MKMIMLNAPPEVDLIVLCSKNEAAGSHQACLSEGVMVALQDPAATAPCAQD